MKKGIKNFKVGNKFSDYLLIKNSVRGVASNGKPFLTIILGDATGEIEAKLWDVSPKDEEAYVPEQIVKIAGEIIQFRNQDQLKIFSIRLLNPDEDLQIDDFIQKAPIQKEELSEEITKAIFEMNNPSIQRIVRAFVQEYQEDLLLYPAAAKNHHAYASGLAHHIVNMLKIARSLCDIYPQLDRDLLFAGVILHDIGKIKELSGVISTQYTVPGQLLGHIPMMVEEIGRMAEKLKIEGEEVFLLQHLVLSHHGKEEWGSPKKPLIQEAEILHYIDMIDAKLNMLDQALEKTKPGEFTERLFPMDNRSFYRPLFKNK